MERASCARRHARTEPSPRPIQPIPFPHSIHPSIHPTHTYNTTGLAGGVHRGRGAAQAGGLLPVLPPPHQAQEAGGDRLHAPRPAHEHGPHGPPLPAARCTDLGWVPTCLHCLPACLPVCIYRFVRCQTRLTPASPLHLNNHRPAPRHSAHDPRRRPLRLRAPQLVPGADPHLPRLQPRRLRALAPPPPRRRRLLRRGGRRRGRHGPMQVGGWLCAFACPLDYIRSDRSLLLRPSPSSPK